jgi:hypothetical protein
MTKPEAQKLGAEMLKQLGKGWKINVSENLGWHVSADKGGLHVSAHKYGSDEKATYSCLLSMNSHPGCGEMFWTSRSGPTHYDPVSAVREQVALARKFLNKAIATVEKTESIANDFKCPCCKKAY